MNEFNFRVANAAPRASFEIGQNVGDTKTTYIRSYKTKYINGKNTGQKSNVDWSVGSIPAWVSMKYAFEGNDCKVTFTTLQENTGSSARTQTLLMTQEESEKTISFPISQEPNFTYTYTYLLEVLNTVVTIGANIGNTTRIMVHSQMTRSDGEVMAKQPSVGATPPFANKVIVKDGSEIAGAPNWYQIIVEATATNLDSSDRNGILLVTCGDQRKEVTVWQKASSPIRITINWPTGTDSAAFFQSGESPQSGLTYFSMSVSGNRTTHNYRKDEGLVVNKSDGKTVYVLPGQRVNCYRNINGEWSFVGEFILPSSDTTVTL